VTTSPAGARIVSLADEQHPVDAQFFGQIPAVDPQTQSQGFLFLVDPNPTKLAPGAAVTGYLRTVGEPAAGVVVPRAAVVRHQGAAWVYLQNDGTNFTRRVLALDRPTGNGWFVTNGVAPGDRVVTIGAQTLLSEELNASGFQGGERE
jgi:multidrug efflux pump subunit AcrA (membrane-fusion protein)